eukprot:524704_1
MMVMETVMQMVGFPYHQIKKQIYDKSTTHWLDKSHDTCSVEPFHQFDAITNEINEDPNHTLNELNEINKDTATKTFSSKNNTNTTLYVIPIHNFNLFISSVLVLNITNTTLYVYNSNKSLLNSNGSNVIYILLVIIVVIVCIFLVVNIFYPIQPHAPILVTLATTPSIQQPFRWSTYPSGMDKNNYIVYESMLYNLDEKITRIHKYNIDIDTWSTFDGLNYVQSTVFCSLINKGKLYLLKAKELTEIQLNTGNMIHHTLNTKMHLHSQLIIINNTLFKIGGTSILKWDTNVNQFTWFSSMYCKKKLHGLVVLESFAMIYNPKNKCLLLFGGSVDYIGGSYARMHRESVDYILEFNMHTRKWNKLAVSLPCKMTMLSCTWAINKTFVLLFGGEGPYYEYHGHIYIYSVKNQTIRRASVDCPCRHVITISKDQQLVCAYIRNQCKMCNFPNELLKLISSYLCRMEYVYLQVNKNGEQMKLST